MSLATAIIRAHAPGQQVEPGTIVDVSVDRIYAQDGNIPTLRRIFAQCGFNEVYDRSRVHFVIDHSTLSPDRLMATRVKEAESFARELGVELVAAGQGISHLIAAERGWFAPGSIVLGADSHTCTGGAWGALALGMGATDIAAAMVTGRTWLRVPESRRLLIVGTPGAAATAKDVMLYALSRFAPETFLYRSIEWDGDWVRSLDEDSAAVLANMSVELGAKSAFVNRKLRDEAGGVATDTMELAIEDCRPMITEPDSIHSAKPLGRHAGPPVDYVFVGSCTNSRYSDLAIVAAVLRRSRVAPGTRLVVTPGTQAIYLRAIESGIIRDIVAGGAVVSPPGCGACVGAQGHVPADDDVVVSTMNRNFRGRMGNPTAKILLASPLVAATAAVYGRVPSMHDVTAIHACLAEGGSA
jgi:3-isopropylmalate/(R)-2-methylmalate dehydratase large subunit